MFKGTIAACLKSVEMHSLQHLASLKVAGLACESEEVQNLLRGFRQTIDRNSNVVLRDSEWRRLRDEVKRKLNSIPIPNVVMETVLDNLWPIGFQVFKWIIHHAEDMGFEWSPKYYWTPRFNIDYVKTAQNLVKNEAFDIKNRFKLACIYCFDSEVRSLWAEMSLSERRCFFLRGNLKETNQNPIVLYWTYYIQEVPVDSWEQEVLNYTHLFRYAVQNGYLTATKFFLDKLERDTRGKMILEILAIHLHDMDKPGLKVKEQLVTACFLIFHICSDRPPKEKYFILLYFLEWPMQKHFMTVANRVKESRRGFSEAYFAYLLESIIEKDIQGFKDYNYKELFIKLWFLFPEYQLYVSLSESSFKILIKFVETHLEFLLEDDASFDMKFKFRGVIFFNLVFEDDTRDYNMENVEFFKFLVRERVACAPVIENINNGLPLDELLHLMNGILECNR